MWPFESALKPSVAELAKLGAVTTAIPAQSLSAPTVIDDAMCNHPFVHLTQKYGEVVVHRGVVYVPVSSATNYTLQTRGIKQHMWALGSVSRHMQLLSLSKSALDSLRNPQRFCEAVKHYYQHPQLPDTDLLRYVDATFRNQYVSDFFSQPFYFRGQDACEPAAPSGQTRAIFTGNGCTVSFEKKSAIHKKINDVVATTFDSCTTSNESPSFDTGGRGLTFQISYKSRSNASALILTSIPEHTVIVDDKTYAFSKTTLKTKLNFMQSDVSLEDYPRVVDQSYKHLFVFSDGQICYNGTNRFWDLGLERSVWHSFDNKLLPYKFARILEQGLLNLTKGYTPTCHPVNSPSTLCDLVVA